MMLNNFRKIISCIILCILIYTSGKTQSFENLPDDFSFKFKNETDGRETYRFDSKTEIYTRQYWMKDSSVRIEISEAEILRIYRAFSLFKFISFPNHFECDDTGEQTISTPSDIITIEFTFNGIVKKVIKSYYCSEKKEKTESENFDKISSLIVEIIHNKPEVQRMKKSNLQFQ